MASRGQGSGVGLLARRSGSVLLHHGPHGSWGHGWRLGRSERSQRVLGIFCAHENALDVSLAWNTGTLK